MPAILAFTSPQVRRLTGLTARMLAYWEQTDVYRATYIDPRPRRPYRRIYTFSDVVSLRALALLRRDHRVPLDELRKTGRHLRQFSEHPWTQKFWLQDRRVLFHHPDAHGLMDRRGQTSYVDISVIWSSVEADTASWTSRNPEDYGHVVRHRHVQRNQWVIKGTRIPTSAVWNFHEAGYSASEIIRQYPTLRAEDVGAAIDHEKGQHQRAA